MHVLKYGYEIQDQETDISKWSNVTEQIKNMVSRAVNLTSRSGIPTIFEIRKTPIISFVTCIKF